MKFIPYQYRPVLKLIRADRPRILIADEVGVGKTIEAGLMIKELRARMELSSILIICPKALVAERKWFLEMKRFDEDFTALDGGLLRHCLRETDLDAWPEKHSKAILPFSLFDQELLFGRVGRGRFRERGLFSLDNPPKFDLVIVDEAHHIRNSETYLHQGVRFFCENAEAVVFLTATPVQLGSQDLFTLLNVLRPDLVIDSASFQQMAEPNQYINAAVQHCRQAKEGWISAARASLESAAGTDWGRSILRESPAFQKAYDTLGDDSINNATRVGLTHSIEALYTFSSLINRTRRRDIGEFTTRKPDTLSVDFTPPQKELHDGLMDVIARILVLCHGNLNVKFMMTTIRRQAASCLFGLVPLLQDILMAKLNRLEVMEAADTDNELDFSFVDQIRADISVLLEQARNLPPFDPKAEAFVKALKDKQSLSNNKVLVFSTFRHTLAYLSARVQDDGFRFGLVHGQVPDEERTEIRRRFALAREDPDAIDILLSSEVGCEGLDFQFCDCIINFDLPWNPMRVEQRIGRIDRYGQRSESVVIINVITPGTVDAEIYERCLLRIGVFHQAVGGSEEILGEITQELHNIAENFQLTSEDRAKRLLQLSDNKIRHLREQQDLESKQSELFGLNISNQIWSEELESADSFWLSPSALQRCVSTYLVARLEKAQEYFLGEKEIKTLRLNQEARNRLLEDFRHLPRSTDPVSREWEKWLKGAQPTLQVSFDQQSVTEVPTVMFLLIGHPIVRQAAAFLHLDEQAYTCLVAAGKDLHPGEYRFGIYEWSKHGIKEDVELVAIANDPQVEDKLFSLLRTAEDNKDATLAASDVFAMLDERHHSRWLAAQANHIADNRLLVDYRIQSLAASHKARHNLLEDQLAGATNEKIQLMKQSELARVDADYARRLQDLERAATTADIHTNPIVFGTIAIR